MRNRQVGVAGGVIAMMLCGVSTFGADILGCPKGIMEGTLWPRLSVQYLDMTEKWNAKEGDLVDIDEGAGLKSKKLIQTDLRLGYGLNSRCDIGVELKYVSVETEKQNATGKRQSFKEAGLTELWMAGKYFIVDQASDSFFNYMKVSVGGALGYGFSQDTEQLVAGVSPGCNKAQLGTLMHGGLHDNFIEYSAHLIYEWRGEAQESDGVPGFPFNRSGEDVPDVLQYQMVVEKGLGEWFEVQLGLTGWYGTQKDDVLLDGSDPQHAYQNNVMAGIQFFPMTHDYEKRKLILQAAMPYASKANAVPDYSVKMIAMWTF
ncbi:MAG: hypothetical protein PHP44_08420 [Kiritimatiellae bacterium]|nr:hypothetical protein [Kiritimatiellia bacterium]